MDQPTQLRLSGLAVLVLATVLVVTGKLPADAWQALALGVMVPSPLVRPAPPQRRP